VWATRTRGEREGGCGGASVAQGSAGSGWMRPAALDCADARALRVAIPRADRRRQPSTGAGGRLAPRARVRRVVLYDRAMPAHEIGSPPPALRRALALASVLLLAGPACSRSADEQPEEVFVVREPVVEEPSYPKIDPDSVPTLDVLYFPEYVGEGYQRVSAKFGPTLHSGKWLGFGHDEPKFFGDHHIIVAHYRSRPGFVRSDYIDKHVLLDVETGKVVASFEQLLHANWQFGLATVSIADDPRPYLLDAESGELVLALPDGDHDFEFRRNYWLVLSNIAKRVWVIARDAEEGVHLYEWEDRSKPPGLPNNPFPFVPDAWDPGSAYTGWGDREEVVQYKPLAACTRAVLMPPNGYECLDDVGLESTDPLSHGWRINHNDKTVFNRRDGTGYDLSGLCGDAQVIMTALERDPARVLLRCDKDDSVWMVWAPSDGVQRLDPESAAKVNELSLSVYYHEDIHRYELVEHWPQGVRTWLNKDEFMLELVGDDYGCPDISYISHNPKLTGVQCKEESLVRWLELTDRHGKFRARFSGSEIAVSRNGVAVAIRRGGQGDRIVPVTAATVH
jgi:hypothetical protein